MSAKVIIVLHLFPINFSKLSLPRHEQLLHVFFTLCIFSYPLEPVLKLFIRSRKRKGRSDDEDGEPLPDA